MFQPEELKKSEPLLWSPGSGTEVWDLFCACAAGDLKTVERLLDKNPQLLRAHHEYRTPLYFAVRENHIAIAQFLLSRGANPFYNGDDLVRMARIRGLVDMESLIESHRPASPRLPSSLGVSTGGIWAAAYLGNLERVREFLDQDPSLANRIADDRSGPPLVHAADRGHLEVVRLLLERGANPNLREEGIAPHGRALYSAVYNRHFEVTELLLEHGANPNQEVESSADAPSIAIMNSDTRTIQLLARYGAVWNIPVQLADS